MDLKDKTKLQIELEKFVADINPMHMVIGTDIEYEDEVRMFLDQINDSMNEDQLTEVVAKVFGEMFNVVDNASFMESYRQVVKEYLRLQDKK